MILIKIQNLIRMTFPHCKIFVMYISFDMNSYMLPPNKPIICPLFTPVFVWHNNLEDLYDSWPMIV